MSYTCKYLQFGCEKPVPGINELTLDASEKPAPVFKFLVDPVTKEIWDLTFTTQTDRSGTMFYTPAQPVPGGADATVKSWYTKEAGSGKQHYLSILPFVITKEGAGFPADEAVITKFSIPGANGNSVNTDNIPGAAVTAEIAGQYGMAKFGMHGENNGVLITSEMEAFDRIVPIMTDTTTLIEGNKITVKKGHSCIVLAVFREKAGSHFKPIRTKPNRDIIPNIGIEILKELSVKERITSMSDLTFNVAGFRDLKTAEKLIDSVIEAHVPALN